MKQLYKISSLYVTHIKVHSNNVSVTASTNDFIIDFCVPVEVVDAERPCVTIKLIASIEKKIDIVTEVVALCEWALGCYTF